MRSPSVDPNLIADALDYVIEGERRLQEILSVSENSLTFRATAFSPSYTVRPVNYLSSSEIAISTAQAGQALILHLVRTCHPQVPTSLTLTLLKTARENHLIFFHNISMQFKSIIACATHKLAIRVDRMRAQKNLLLGHFAFIINDGECLGTFAAVIAIDKLSSLQTPACSS